MSISEREAWFTDWLRPLWGPDRWIIKVDGHLVAIGSQTELPDMLDRFNQYIDGPDVEPQRGGMG